MMFGRHLIIAKAPLVVIILMSAGIFGVAAGAAQDSAPPPVIDVDNESHYINGSELQEREPENRHQTPGDVIAQRIGLADIEIEYPGSQAVDGVVFSGMASLRNGILRLGYQTANLGYSIGYHNRSWMSPFWVGLFGQGFILISFAGYLIITFSRVSEVVR